MHTLELKGLCVRKEAKDILRDINLLVHGGDKILIQGPSGSGKSTLLRAVLGFEKCSRGAVVCDGARVSSSTIRDFRSQCTYIGQSPLIYEGTVLEYVHLPFGFKVNRGRCPGEEDILAILQELGFAPEILTAEYRSLSGGEQQRVTIAQAMLLKRDLYLLDEVTSSLDQANIMRVIDLFTVLLYRELSIRSPKNRSFSLYPILTPLRGCHLSTLCFLFRRARKTAPATKRSPMTIRIAVIAEEGVLIKKPITRPMSAEPIPNRIE